MLTGTVNGGDVTFRVGSRSVSYPSRRNTSFFLCVAHSPLGAVCLRELLLRSNEMTYENVQLAVWCTGRLTPQETVVIVLIFLVLRMAIYAVRRISC